MPQAERLLDHLNPPQRLAASTLAHCNVLALPGSGKTRILVAKTQYIKAKFPKARIVLVSFTRASATELVSRIHKETGKVIPGVTGGTFHALSGELLKKHKIRYNLISGEERNRLVFQVVEDFQGKINYEKATTTIDKIKSSIERYAPEALDREIYAVYEKLLRSHNVIDMADMVLIAAEGLKKGTIKPLNVDYMMVDEYQDADEVQACWIEAHITAGVKVTVVGDDDQSIYGWRHGMGYPGMVRFEKTCGAQRVVLSDNYRNRAEILAAANTLIKNNLNRAHKQPNAIRGMGGKVEIALCKNRRDEALNIAKYVAQSPGDWTVLARTNRMLDSVESVLDEKGIPFTKMGSSFWDLRIVSIYISLFRSIGKGDSFGISNALSWCGVKVEVLRLLQAEAKNNLAEGLKRGLNVSGLNATDSKTVKGLGKNLVQWDERLKKGDTGAIITGIQGWMVPHTNRKASKDNLEIASNALLGMKGSILQRVNNVLSQDKEEGKGVILQTLHRAKGLEFPRVWIIGVEEGILPSKKAPNIEEERRLMYVGMTRAKDHLVLSCSAEDGRPSPFLMEARLMPKSST